MNPVFDDDELSSAITRLSALAGSQEAGPGATVRQPIHTVYGGAHLFREDTVARLGAAARRSLEAYAPDWTAFARAIGIAHADRLPSLVVERARLETWFSADPEAARRAEPAAFLARRVHTCTLARLEREPVEDYRVDFEDGYGVRSDTEEDGHAVAVAEAMARAHTAGALPAFTGIRIKPLAPATARRAVRTLERFLATLLERTNGELPRNFVVTVPKVERPAEVELLAELLARLERAHALTDGAIRCELMLETPRAFIDAGGRVPLRSLASAAQGRCRGMHLGVYDLTAALGVGAADQGLEHRAASFARQLAQLALAGSGVQLADGALTRLPVPVHPAAAGGTLTASEEAANRGAIHGAWRAHYEAVRRALREGWVQGWDLHPAQLPTRHAAVVAHYLEGRDDAVNRLRALVGRAASAHLHGSSMDDAATGLGLLNFLLRGHACGALDDTDLAATGLTADEMRSRDFARIVAARVPGETPN